MKKILFVCTANTCRSPMAEGFLNSEAEKNKFDLYSESAGTHAVFGMPASKHSVDSMKKYGIDISNHNSKPAQIKMIKEFDLVLGMTKEHSDTLCKMFPVFKDKIHVFCEYVKEKSDIKDPFGESYDLYLRQCDKIKFYVEKLTKLLVDM